jgi:hypothetical protein
MWPTVETSERGPTLAPRARSQGTVYIVAYRALVLSRLVESSWSAIHLRTPSPLRTGWMPVGVRRRTIFRPPATTAQTVST